MGRSSASCEYQFSSNRLISRVHVEACYKPANSRLERDRVEITCSGWNGIKIHCKGQVYEIKKGETFSSDVRDSEIMVDVHDSRVVVGWPPKPYLGAFSSEDEDDADSPTKRQRVLLRHSTPPSPSPMQSRRRLSSPISPSPAVQAAMPSSPPLPAATVEIYEDPEPTDESSGTVNGLEVSHSTQVLSQSVEQAEISQNSTSTSPEDFSDNDEENDPIIHSFGIFGANLLPRMASISAGDSPNPSVSLQSTRSSHTEPSAIDGATHPAKEEDREMDVKSHVINQLAFSRLSSTPLSTILSHLPSEAGTLSINEVRKIIRETACIGEVRREGKDAAGKTLESEFYYIPDEDEDDNRKEAVVNDLRKPGLRACRKQHKVLLFLQSWSRANSLVAILLAKTKMIGVQKLCFQRCSFESECACQALQSVVGVVSSCFVFQVSSMFVHASVYRTGNSICQAFSVTHRGRKASSYQRSAPATGKIVVYSLSSPCSRCAQLQKPEEKKTSNQCLKASRSSRPNQSIIKRFPSQPQTVIL